MLEAIANEENIFEVAAHAREAMLVNGAPNAEIYKVMTEAFKAESYED